MGAALAPIFATAAGVVLVAGVAKLRAPEPAQAALAAGAWPHRILFVRALAVTEIALGGAGLVAPSPPSALALAGAYAVFCLFLARLLRSGNTSIPCGCFGRRSFEPRAGHFVLNACGLVASGLAALAPPPAPAEVWADPLAGAILTAGVACSVYLCYLLFTLAPWAALGAPPPYGSRRNGRLPS